MAIDFKTLRTKNTPKIPFTVIYGPGKRGKTTMAAGAPHPIFLAVEDGLGQLEVPSWKITSYNECIQALDLLAGKDHEFDSVVIDSIDWLEPLIWDQACKDNNWGNIEDPGYGKGYIHALKYWREVIDTLKYLRDVKCMIPILIAHHVIKRFDDPANEPYDQYRLKLQDRAAALVEEAADLFGFLNYRVTIQRSKQDFGATVSRAEGNQRVLHVDGRPAYVAGNRYGLPATIDIPKTNEPAAIWDKVVQYLPEIPGMPDGLAKGSPNGEVKESNEEVKEEPTKTPAKTSPAKSTKTAKSLT